MSTTNSNKLLVKMFMGIDSLWEWEYDGNPMVILRESHENGTEIKSIVGTGIATETTEMKWE